ncbi:acyltransferase family protein [Aromatoleum toluvorans]|nr:acyltransferase [Aromatoleum toluvorans]
MKRLELLDYGRFFAAIIVVLFHYTFNGIANGKITSISHIAAVIELSKYGYLGVELFFMISGYVIFFSARSGAASRFAVGRAVRLYPAYWFAVLFTSFFALQWGGDLMSVGPRQVLANLSMLQSFFGVPHVDGVYWTLLFEVTFYGAVLLLLLFGLQKHLRTLFMFWPVLLLASLALGMNALPYLGGYYCYFSAGALFAVLKQQFRWGAVFGLAVVYGLCVKFSAGGAAHLTQAKGIEFSPVVIASVITLFFALFAFQNTKKGESLKLPLSRTFGALTYPIYLIHAHFGYMFISRFATEENKIAIYALTVSMVVAIALFVHKLIEQRLSHVWKRLFTGTIGRFVDLLQGMLLRMNTAYSVSFSRTPPGGG